MPLKTLIKVGSLTNLSDARYCAGMDVQMLGFQAVPDLPRHLPAAKFQEIRGWVTGPKIVAEVHGVQSQSQLELIIETYRPDYLELGLNEVQFMGTATVPVILALRPDEFWDEAIKANMSLQSLVAYALVDIADARELPVPKIVHVASFDEALIVLEKSAASGMALLGSDELSPGLKSYDTLAPILEMLEDES